MLTLDKSSYDQGLKDAEGSGSSFASSLGTGISSAVSTVGKGVLAATAAAAAGVGAITKTAVSNYAEYEQLVGGIETLYGDSADTMFQYASTAYKTAGMSANDYMETATSFAASLVQSLGGDTATAAEYADMAISDMSDNANKMGTDITSIQNAYQGFAKGNYTMLDNLKLGYGGTGEEMQRLIDHANELKEANGEMADLSIDSYADIVEAIHLVQDEMGVTGTTAAEASTTIQGSLSSVKAAWSNLLTGLADENADIDSLVDNLLDSLLGEETEGKVGERVGGLINNVMPRIETALQGIGTLVEELAPVIGEVLPQLLDDILPSLITAATGLVTSFAEALPDLLGTLATVIPQALTTVLTEAVPTLLTAIPDIFNSVVTAIGTAISDFTAEDVEPAVSNLTYQLGLKLATLVENISSLLPQLASIASALITGIATGISDLATDGTISDAVKNVVNTGLMLAGSAIDTLTMLIPLAVNVINGIIDGLNNIDQAQLTSLGDSIGDLIVAAAQGIASIDWNSLADLALKIADAIITAIGNLDYAAIGDAIGTFIENGGLKVLGLVVGWSWIKTLPGKMVSAIRLAIFGEDGGTIGSAISSLITKAAGTSTVTEAFKNIGTSIAGKVTSAISSAMESGVLPALGTVGVVAGSFVALAAIISAQGDEIHTTVEEMETDKDRVIAVQQALADGEATEKEVWEATVSYVTNLANDTWAIIDAAGGIAEVSDEQWGHILSNIVLAGESGVEQFGYLQDTLTELGATFDLTTGQIVDSMTGEVLASMEQFGWTYDEASQSVIDSNGNIVASLVETADGTVIEYNKMYEAVDAQVQAESKAELAAQQHSTAVKELAEQYHISYDEAEALYNILNTPPDVSETNAAMDSVGDTAVENTTESENAFENMTAEELANMDTLVAELPTKAGNALANMYNAFTGPFAESVKTAMQTLTDSILDKVTLLASRMYYKGQLVVTKLANGMTSQTATAESAATTLENAVDVDLYDSMYNSGWWGGAGLAQGLNACWSWVYSAAASLASAAAQGANITLRVSSPSKVFREIGDYAGQGLALGMLDEIENVEAASSELANAAITDVETNVSYSSIDATAPKWAQDLSSQIANIGIYLDGDTLVGQTINRIDSGLETLSNNTKRNSGVFAW